MGRIIAGLILILIGLSAFAGVSWFKFGFALILIVIGIAILSGHRHNWHWDTRAGVSNEEMLNEVAIFSSINKVVQSENFKGGKIVTVFGGGEIDLSHVKTSEKNVNMEFVAVFGGGKLIIPKDWRVNSQGIGIFGGYSSKAVAGEGETTLNIKGAAIFGGVEIVN